MINEKVEQYIISYIRNYKIGKKDWNYEDGCVLGGAVQLYKATNRILYLEFVVNYMEQYINENGSINNYSKGNYNIDSINSGKILFFLYEETGNEKYRKAIETLMDQLRSHPRTKSGNFWHKQIYPNQIWLDGLYMAQPFYMAYETIFNDKKNYNDILNQFENVRKLLFDEDKKLYYHAYDEAKIQPWSNKDTGRSPNFWIRSMGWYLMALVDTMSVMLEEIFEQYKYYESLFKEGIQGILNYQEPKSKLFYQIIDKSGEEGNYLETSGSVMVCYAILKACRLGILQKEKYQKIGENIFISLVRNKLVEKEGILQLTDICSVAGVGPGDKRNGSVEYYLSEPIVSDDPKGSGVLMMAYAQMLLLDMQEGK